MHKQLVGFTFVVAMLYWIDASTASRVYVCCSYAILDNIRFIIQELPGKSE